MQIGRPSRSASLLLKNRWVCFDFDQIEYELLEAGHCFVEITPSTFIVDEHTGIPMMSPAALYDIVPMKPSQTEFMGGANMSHLADVIDHEVIGSDNPVPDEVGSGLLAMMRNEGFKRRYVIAHHSSLVPIENRPDLGLRMYQQLHDIVEILDPARGDWALYHIEAPATWHTDVQSNRYAVVSSSIDHFSVQFVPSSL
jgi:hypothetical protein